jgi:hypothetical protein
MKNNLSLIFFLISCIFLNAQEGLRPLTFNPNLFFPKKNTINPASVQKNRSSLSLPFYDDFSYAAKSNYPDLNRWEDSSVYVNDGMGIAPLNYGVATFDGLNKKGYPYTPNFNFPPGGSGSADVLTSRPINLHTLGSQTLAAADSIALIFYYQKGGYGDNPEIQDSLMLDFFKPKQNKWQNRVWHQKGQTNPNAIDTQFKRVFIFITDTAYLHEGFRFRFRNKAQTNGNFDIWNIDEVYLDKNRSMKADTAWIDVSFGRRTSPFLKRYSAMPRKQFQPDEMATQYSNYIRYNGTNTVNTTYQMEIRDENNTLLHTMNYGASNLHPFWTGGWQTNTVHSTPVLSYTFPPMADSVTFTIKHFMNSLAGDTRNQNDTLYMFQEFKNYFAYDDGTCENGYYVFGTGGKAVYFYHLNHKDTLRAVRIHFDPVGNLSLNQSYTFRLQVYTSNNGIPGTRIYNDSLKNVQYLQGGHDLFAEYELASPLILNPGDYFIGYQQFVAAGITVGFDANYHFPGKLFYDSGNGWMPSSLKGSLMMRPVFGKKPIPQSVKEYSNNTQNIILYPNPFKDMLHIDAPKTRNLIIRIYDINGKMLLSRTFSSLPMEMSLAELQSGIYFYECQSDSGIQRGKLLKE